MGTKNPRKTHKFIFSPKWWQKLLPVAVFGHIVVLHCRLGHFSQVSKNFHRHFLRYFESKLKNSKIIFKSYKKFTSANF